VVRRGPIQSVFWVITGWAQTCKALRLANQEAQISRHISDTVAALAGYGITEAEVKAEWPGYFQHCIDNDLF
jgi:hypothetical protein